MRQTLDIEEFKYGIISSVDEENIPSESASDSLNIDGDVGEGILRGIPTDVEKLIDSDNDGTADDALTNVKMGEFIEDAGIYYFVYWDDTDDKLKVIKDFYGTTPIREELLAYTSGLSDPVTNAVVLGSQLSFTKENKSIRIGTGNNEALWVGIPKHKQLGITDYTSIYLASGVPGLDDMTSVITGYNKIKSTFYDIVIASTGATDAFTWSKEGGVASASIPMTGSAQAIGDGITVTFAATTGHTALDAWRIFVDGISIEKAECDTYFGTSSNQFVLTTTEHAGTGYFQNGLLYSWKYSLVYDGVEESPIGEDTIAVSDPSTGADYYTVVFKADNALTLALGFFNRRITGVNIYRADSIDGTKSGLGLYRLIQSFDINDANWATTGSDRTLRVVDYGTYYSYTAGGATLPSNPVTYKENSGIGETIYDVLPRYEFSRTGNGHQFIAKCYHSKIPDATRYIFKSKYLRYDIYDWTEDLLVMPEPITALEFYEGKLWVFSLNKMYRINAEGFYIEDVFDDAGCQGQRAVHTTEYGMFFANFTNAWMYSQGGLNRISDAIRQSASGGRSWQTFTNSTLEDIIVTSDAKKGYVLFINDYVYGTTDYRYLCWAYHPVKKRWDCWNFGQYTSSATGGAFKGKDGQVYLSNASKTYELMRNTGYQLWEWISQEFTFGKTRQVKSLTMIKADATGTVAIGYGVDGATPATAYTNEALMNVYNKTLRIKLSAASGTNYVDSMETVYRPLVGNR